MSIDSTRLELTKKVSRLSNDVSCAWMTVDPLVWQSRLAAEKAVDAHTALREAESLAKALFAELEAARKALTMHNRTIKGRIRG